MRILLFLVVLCLFLPSFALAAETGLITGVIVDGKTAEPLIEAGVEVVETGKKVFTDIDGKYSLSLPTGNYEIRVFYPQYQGQRVKDIVVVPGKPARIDLSLVPKAADVQVVEVVVEAAKAAETTQLLIRKKAAAVTDNVSAETISKQPDSDVAAVVERAPGVTVVDDKFVYIRGLGERYTSASLNDTALPSTQMEKKVVPLDLFSADMVESINVVKSYTPDLPGEFTAGVVQITTKDYPDAFELKLSASAGYNSKTTGKDFKTYKGGDWDWLAFDDGTRELPDNIPDQKVTGGNFTQEELEKFGKSFSNIWDPETETAPPALGASFHIGNKYDKFGFIFDLSYDADYQTKEEKFVTYTPEMRVQQDQDLTYWEEKYNLNGVLNMGYEPAPGHKISFKNLYTQNATDQVRTSEGFYEDYFVNDTDEINKKTARLYWSEESVYSGQLLGDHRLEGLKSLVHWRLGYGRSTLDEPDMRDVLYRLNFSGAAFEMESGGRGAQRRFTELEEDMWQGGLDWELDLKELLGHPVKAKFGPAYSFRDRTFDYRKFAFEVKCGVYSGIDCTEDPESILDEDNIRPSGVVLNEFTQPSDHYEADHTITAGYLMADTPYFFFENLRFVGGLRVEKSEQTLDAFERSHGLPIHVVHEDTDYLPSASLIYNLSKDMNLRLGYSQTVNRPEFREISPTLFRDMATGIDTYGNPELKRARIKSYDLRWEWFLGPEELLAVSLFYKDLKDPIERLVIIGSGASYESTFQNAKKATNYGFELEARKNLGFIHPNLSPFSVFANYTYVDSEVEIQPEGFKTVNMELKHPLQGQSDHIANVILEYSSKKADLVARLLYNYVGERLSDVGVGGPDIIEEPSQTLDLIVIKRFGNLGLKLSAKNLLNEEVLLTQGGKVQQRYKEGTDVSIGISYAF